MQAEEEPFPPSGRNEKAPSEFQGVWGGFGLCSLLGHLPAEALGKGEKKVSISRGEFKASQVVVLECLLQFASLW